MGTTRTVGIQGRLALVTGAASGIGAAVAHGLAARGATVCALDRDTEGLEKVVCAITADGYRASGFRVDVTDRRDVESTVLRIGRECGPADILVNVAGVLRTGPLLDLADEDWSAMLAVNTTAVFTVSRAVARGMAVRGSGTIVTVASNAGGVPRKHMGGYAASKAASVVFTRCLGLELAEYGIRCNVVSPGSTDTPMLRAMWHDESDRQSTLDGSLPAYRVGIPLRKLARPQDIADAVAFLVSDEAGHITMHDLYVDGGAALGG